MIFDFMKTKMKKSTTELFSELKEDKNIEIIDQTNEYAIVKKQTLNGISLYDHICLNASEVSEGDLISS